jgi:hypothetical protein
MSDPMEHVLRLVAEGRLTADEAEPILAALASAADSDPDTRGRPQEAATDRPRFARIEVRENGRRVVDMRIPLAFGMQALSSIPGLLPDHASTLRAAVDSGLTGPILDVTDEDGDGARIVIE